MLPDLLGYELNEGVRILREAGYADPDIVYTQSPRNKQDQSTGNHRIVKIIQTKTETIQIIACRIKEI